MLKDIVASCQYVSNNSKNVKINYSKVDELLNEVLTFNNCHYLESSPFGVLDLSTSDLVNFLLIYESIDFSFWGNPKWTIESSIGNIDGAFALLYSLLELFKKIGGKFIFAYLENMKFEEFKEILKGNVEIPLLEKRYNILIDMARIVNTKMNGNFYNYIKGINKDTQLFELIISNFSFFLDTRTYLNKDISFYKLAQLLTSDILHVLKLKKQVEVDYSNLIGCADYKIPQVMRGLGILEYSTELSNIVDNKLEILENSPYEIEIRANMITVINYIYEKLDKKINRININDFIWLKSQDKTLNYKPYHLTRTTNY